VWKCSSVGRLRHPSPLSPDDSNRVIAKPRDTLNLSIAGRCAAGTRNAVVRQALLKSPGTAWRLLIAHAIAASGYWHVKRDPQQARSGENAASVAGSTARQAFTAERQVVLGLLDQPDDASVESSNGDPYRTAVVFARLLALGEDEVLRIAAFVMAETLAAGVPLVEALGIRLKVDVRDLSQPDEIFFDLMRGRLRECATGRGRRQARRRRQSLRAHRGAEADHLRPPHRHQRPREGRVG
jgi:hypothetical protein